MAESNASSDRTSEIFAERDRFMRLLGMRILESRRGYARVMLEVRDDHLNIYASVHGGVIMSLADEAFGVVVTGIAKCIGVQWSLNITRAPRLGDVLYAESNVVHEGSRMVVCDMKVRDGRGRLVAAGTATALVIAGTPEDTDWRHHKPADRKGPERG